MSKSPDATTTMHRLHDMLCRHLVALCIVYRRKDERPARNRFAAYSGTLFRIKGAIFYLTAGHILRDVETARADENIEIVSAGLVDGFSSSRRTTDPAIPFDLRNARLLYIDEHGLDFGMISLEPYCTRLLRSVALGEENWIRDDAPSFDEFILLGLPAEFTTDTGVVSPTICHLQRLESPPDGSETLFPRFYAKLNPKSQIQDVNGMSGGPIFGFRFQPQPRYWVVALQSSWLPTQRIVFGCPLPILAKLLSDVDVEPQEP